MTLVARTVDGMCVTGLLHLMSKYTRSRAELGFFACTQSEARACKKDGELLFGVDPPGTIHHLFFDHGILHRSKGKT